MWRDLCNPGSSAVAALLEDGTFTPRALTRDATSDAALKLKANGAEVAQVDLNDKTSIVSALRGSEAVFGVSKLCAAGTRRTRLDN